jgi:hypothetical protein
MSGGKLMPQLDELGMKSVWIMQGGILPHYVVCHWWNESFKNRNSGGTMIPRAQSHGFHFLGIFEIVSLFSELTGLEQQNDSEMKSTPPTAKQH